MLTGYEQQRDGEWKMKCIESGLVRVGAPYVEPHPEDEPISVPAAASESFKEENSEYVGTAARKKTFLAANNAAAEQAAAEPEDEEVLVEADEPAYEIEEAGEEKEEEQQEVEEESAAGGAADEGEVDALADDLKTIAIRKRGGAKK